MLTDLTPKKDGVIAHNMEDDVIRGATVAHDGAVTYPPPPPKIAGHRGAKAEAEGQGTDAVVENAARRRWRPSRRRPAVRWACLAIGGGLLLLAGLYAPASFMSHFIVFVLAVFVGFQVIWNVSAQLHTPLDGGDQRHLVDHHPGRAVADRVGPLAGGYSGGAVGLLMAGINIFGGFMVTRRMLAMFQKS